MAVPIAPKRRLEELNHGTPAALARRAISRASSSVAASGLSMNSGLCAAITGFTCARWRRPSTEVNSTASTLGEQRGDVGDNLHSRISRVDLFGVLVDAADALRKILTTPLTYVKGIGPARAAMLEAKGLVTVEDLLGYVPFRYEDRSNMKTIAQLAPGEMATVIAEVRAVKLSGFKRRSLGMFEARFTDASRAILVGKWFHGGYLANVLAEGMKVALFGKVEFDSYSGELTMLHPEFEILSGDDDEGEAALHVGRVVPIYEGRRQDHHARLPQPDSSRAGIARPLEDALPQFLRDRLKMPDRWTALRDIHFPPPDTDLRLLNAFRSPAQFRLIFEEFFWLECGVALKRGKARSCRASRSSSTTACASRSRRCCRSSPPARRSACWARSRTTWRPRTP